jgi:hypothetical protein
MFLLLTASRALVRPLRSRNDVKIMSGIFKRATGGLVLNCWLKTRDLRLDGHAGEIAVVVFSKDRPVQLEALLRSADRHMQGSANWAILWHASNTVVEDAYRSLLEHWESRGRLFIRQYHFRKDLLSILSGFPTERAVLFLVDDLLFVGAFDLSLFSRLNLRRQLPSLRLGTQISYSQPQGVASPPPGLSPSAIEPWLEFSWTESCGDWAMPLSLDGHLLPLDETRFLCSQLSFHAPNSLEKALGCYRFLYKHRRGLCLNQSTLVNFAFNRVQSENADFPCGEWSPEMMLAKWNEGYRLDIEGLAKEKASSCHVVREPLFEPRT